MYINHSIDRTINCLRRKRTLGLLIASLAFIAFFAAAPSARAEEQPVHIVQPGETLSEIAKAYGVSTETLRRLNGFADADTIWVGFPVYLPAESNTEAVTLTDAAAALSADSAAAEREIPRPERLTEAEDAVRYTVQTGDTLPSIARANRVSVAELVALNRISPAQRLHAGRTLLVPESNTLSTGERIHIARPGESWYSIAEKYFTTVDDLLDRNDLPSWAVLRAGQELIAPPLWPFETMADLPLDENGHHMHRHFPTDEKWIDVDLSEQRVVAYEGDRQLAAFDISSGRDNTPTVIGEFRIWIKTAVQDMYGDRAADDYYYLRDVKWVQYFHQDYSFHTAYWHNNFGQPMSHGCINMREEDAKWLFEFTGPHWDEDGEDWQKPTAENPGTLVIVHK